MTSTPVRAIYIDTPASEAYSLESVGKHGFGKRLASEQKCFLTDFFLTVGGGWTFHFAALEVGPQPNGVLRADIYNLVKEAVELTMEFVEKFNAGEKELGLCNCTEKRNQNYSKATLQCRADWCRSTGGTIFKLG